MAKVEYGECGVVKAIHEDGEGVKSSSSKSFHEGGFYHDTYASQARYVSSLGNQWASENFNATRPYFA